MLHHLLPSDPAGPLIANRSRLLFEIRTPQEIQGIDDGEMFNEVTAALVDVGISPEQQEVLFALLSGVLWLGNIKVGRRGLPQSAAFRGARGRRGGAGGRHPLVFSLPRIPSMHAALLKHPSIAPGLGAR